MSTGYDCDWEQGLCYPSPGRGSPYKTHADCVTSCSQYCHLPDFMVVDNLRLPVPGTCRKRLVEYYDARRPPGCPTSMTACRSQFGTPQVVLPRHGPAMEVPPEALAGAAHYPAAQQHVTPSMTLDGFGDATHRAYAAAVRK